MLQVTPEQFSDHRSQLTFSCIVENRRKTEIYLTNAYVIHPYSYFSLEDPQNNIGNGKVIKLLPGGNI